MFSFNYNSSMEFKRVLLQSILSRKNLYIYSVLLNPSIQLHSSHNMALQSCILFIFFLLFKFSTTCCYARSLTEPLKGGFSVELIHRDSPKSPFYNPTKTLFQKLNTSFHRSLDRVNHFYAKPKATKNTPQSVIISNQGEYLVKYSIGTPPFEVMGIADTGSDLIWSQCKPCEQCYNQTSPLFDPSKSKTYEPVSCYSTVCQTLGQTYCLSDAQPNCQYTVSYGDGSHSQGNLAFDTLTLGSTTGNQNVPFRSFHVL